MSNRFLLSLVLLLFIFSTCTETKYSRFTLTDSKRIDSTDLPSLFKSAEKAPLYKAAVNLYGKKFGGLLLIKNMADSSYRIVFTTETGIKLFDFEIKGEKFTVHYCIEKFNRDAVLNTIASDIKLLLLENRKNQTAQLLSRSEEPSKIYRFTSEKTQDYYFTNSENKQLKELRQVMGKKTKVVIALQYGAGIVPNNIHIAHKNIRLKIDLNLLER